MIFNSIICYATIFFVCVRKYIIIYKSYTIFVKIIRAIFIYIFETFTKIFPDI